MPKLSVRQYARILFETTQGLNEIELNYVTQAFTQFVAKNQMIKKMPNIIQEFVTLCKKMAGVVEMEVISAFPLSGTMQKQIKEIFGRKVEMKLQASRAIIGGLKIKTENKIFDASVKRQLMRMKETLS